MPICDYYFYPYDKSFNDREKLEDQIHSYAATLLKNGNINGEYILAWLDNAIRLTCYIPEKSALSEENMSNRSKQEFKQILKLSKKKPEHKIQFNHKYTRKTKSWKKSDFLYFFTHSIDNLSPVVSSNTNDPIPLYKLPITEIEREEIYSWTMQYRNVHSVWFDSGSLETSAYDELTDPNSKLSKSGRKLCKLVEKATKKEVYYYLFFYRENELEKIKKQCPDCRRLWFRKRVTHKHNFDFLCKKCRLVSDLPANYNITSSPAN